jgi:Transcriptional Coactivator p15 (PC4)
VRLNEFNGCRTVDFRRYLYLQAKEDLLPTQKGVSLDRESFSIIQAALNQNIDRISLWLKMLFDGVGQMSPQEMFETLEINWGIILKRYAERLGTNE